MTEKPTPESIWKEHLELCHCGRPEESHAFLIALLESFDRGKFGFEGDCGIERNTRLISEDPEQAAYLIAYMFDRLGLTEHGGVVGGSWLSQKGKEVIAAGPMIEDMSET